MYFVDNAENKELLKQIVIETRKGWITKKLMRFRIWHSLYSVIYFIKIKYIEQTFLFDNLSFL